MITIKSFTLGEEIFTNFGQNEIEGKMQIFKKSFLIEEKLKRHLKYLFKKINIRNKISFLKDAKEN